MKLLILTQYFWPEQFIINDLAKALKSQGHEIVVATGKPNYPEGAIFDGYEVAGPQTERFDGDIEVVRAPLRPRGKASGFDLFRNYLSFVWSGLWWFPRLLKGRSFDCILVFAPSPITMAIPAIPLKWSRKAHLAIWVQDLWPENLPATGYLTNRAALAAVGVLVRAIYSCADTLLVQSLGFVEPVAGYAAREKILYYPNAAPAPPPTEITEAARVRPELISLLESKFCIVFAGNIGRAQSIGTLVETAQMLKDLSDVRIVIVGTGSMLSWLKAQKIDHGLDNLVLSERAPMSAMPEIYCRAAGLAVTLKDEEILSFTIPSKIQAYLAAGKPIVAAVDGESARVITDAGAGFVSPSEDSFGLANSIRSLYGMTESARNEMGMAGRRYFLEHFEMTKQAGRLVELLQRRIAETERKN